MLDEAIYGQVYLAAGCINLRKSIDGLAVLVKERFQLDPFSNCLFVFCNRNRDKLKILHWEHNGFWLYYRRLERGKIPNVTLVGCLAHARRKFNDALNALPPGQKDADVPAKEGLNFCNQLFAIERKLAELTPEERYKQRLELPSGTGGFFGVGKIPDPSGTAEKCLGASNLHIARASGPNSLPFFKMDGWRLTTTATNVPASPS